VIEWKQTLTGTHARPFFLSNLLRAIEYIKNADANLEQSGSVLKGMRLLCAEDNGLNAEILNTILEMEDASCTSYLNGQLLWMPLRL